MPLSNEEKAVLGRVLNDPLYAGALKNFFRLHEQANTEKARNALNVIPKNLHDQAHQHELAKQYAALAKAYGQAFAELEKAVRA